MNHTLDAIAWTLIHFCWQAGVIALLYAAASLALVRNSSQMRYTLAAASLALMTVSAFATFSWQMSLSRPSPALHDAAAEIRTVAREAVGPITGGRAAAAKTEREISTANILRWIDGFWVLGVALLSLRSLSGWWVIQRLRATAIDEAPEAVRASFERIANALGLRREVLLRVSSAVAGPITIGALRAMVLLPVSAVTLLGPDELEMVLAHELAHVRRADFLCNLLQTLVETLFFFHPAVWWMGKCIRHERELCCDDMALKICPNPVTYATALFRLEEQRVRQWRLAMALDGHQSNQTLRVRIARILGDPAAQVRGRSIQPLSLVVAGIALLVSLLATPPVVASFAPAHVARVQRVALVAIAKPSAAVRVVRALPVRASVVEASAQAATPGPGSQAASSAEPKSTYIDRMKAAGYDVDLDKYIAMKIQGVTPEFAQEMAQAGFGKLSADDLIACKIHGISSEEIAKLKQEGFEIRGIQDAISFKIFNVTPEFVAGMKAAGFANLSQQQILSLRVQGVTPEYAQEIAKQFPGASVEDVIKTRIFHIDSAFIEQAKRFGLKPLTLDRLVQLRISGVLDDEAVKP
jgi:beta-lactamase regulating signal transducer with metallopeptidase domain